MINDEQINAMAEKFVSIEEECKRLHEIVSTVFNDKNLQRSMLRIAKMGHDVPFMPNRRKVHFEGDEAYFYVDGNHSSNHPYEVHPVEYFSNLINEKIRTRGYQKWAVEYLRYLNGCLEECRDAVNGTEDFIAKIHDVMRKIDEIESDKDAEMLKAFGL